MNMAYKRKERDMEKLNGFYCRMYGKDCFFETNQARRTKKLAEDFILSVQYKTFVNGCPHYGDKDIEWVQKNMKHAIFEMKTIQKGNFTGLSYYEISGEDFSYGCDPCENPMERCILVN
jgi:hypothetical protein